jgi:proteasome assembly chaperone 2
MNFISLSPQSKDLKTLAGPAWTLVLPAVTIGNVGQLAVDLFLTNCLCNHIGRLRAPAVLPVVGAAISPPAHRSSVLSAIEVYVVEGASVPIVLLQQRAPIAPGLALEHAQAILDWAMEAGCTQILVLASANAAGRRDAQLRTSSNSVSSRLRIAATTAAFERENMAARARDEFGWKAVEGPDSRGWAAEGDNTIDEDRIQGTGAFPAFLPTSRRGAFVRSILECSDAKKIPTTSLLIFVHEGDNSGDAIVMASAASVLLGLRINAPVSTSEAHPARASEGQNDPVLQACHLWQVPPLWKMLFAPPPPRGLY